jgi:hypothetical protein
MKIRFDPFLNDPERDRISDILKIMFMHHYPAVKEYYSHSDRNKQLDEYVSWLESLIPCKIKMSTDHGVYGIEEIDLEEKDYLLLILKYYNENKFT